MNTGNTYYFIDDFNNICKQETGMKKEESIVLTLQELLDDVNNLVEENEQLKKEAKHQQGQKQRLMNYLQQYLSVEEIREIANDDKYLSGERIRKGVVRMTEITIAISSMVGTILGMLLLIAIDKVV